MEAAPGRRRTARHAGALVRHRPSDGHRAPVHSAGESSHTHYRMPTSMATALLSRVNRRPAFLLGRAARGHPAARCAPPRRRSHHRLQASSARVPNKMSGRARVVRCNTATMQEILISPVFAVRARNTPFCALGAAFQDSGLRRRPRPQAVRGSGVRRSVRRNRGVADTVDRMVCVSPHVFSCMVVGIRGRCRSFRTRGAPSSPAGACGQGTSACAGRPRASSGASRRARRRRSSRSRTSSRARRSGTCA